MGRGRGQAQPRAETDLAGIGNMRRGGRQAEAGAQDDPARVIDQGRQGGRRSGERLGIRHFGNPISMRRYLRKDNAKTAYMRVRQPLEEVGGDSTTGLAVNQRANWLWQRTQFAR